MFRCQNLALSEPVFYRREVSCTISKAQQTRIGKVALGSAHREIFPSVEHRTGQCENNRAEVSHQHTREQERQMRQFKSIEQTQRFLAVHGQVQNLFRVGRHLLKAIHHRLLRDRSFADWSEVTCTQ